MMKDRRMDLWRDEWICGWMDPWMGRFMEGRMDPWMDRLMDGWMDPWMDGFMDPWMDPLVLGSPHTPPPSRGLPPVLPCPGQLREGSVLSSCPGHTSELFLVSELGLAGADGASQGQSSARPVLPSPGCWMLGWSRHRGLCSASPWDLPLDFSTSVGGTAGEALWAPCGCTAGWEISPSDPRGSAASQGQISDLLLSVLSDFLDGSFPTAVFRDGSSVSRFSQGQMDSGSLLLFSRALVASLAGGFSFPGAVPFTS